MDAADWSVTGLHPGTDLTLLEAKTLKIEMIIFMLFVCMCVSQTFSRRDTSELFGINYALRAATIEEAFGDSNILDFPQIAVMVSQITE